VGNYGGDRERVTGGEKRFQFRIFIQMQRAERALKRVFFLELSRRGLKPRPDTKLFGFASLRIPVLRGNM